MSSILIIDDQVEPQEHMKGLADLFYVRAHQAYTGDEAIELWQRERLDIDMIFLDYQLGDGKDGRMVVWGDAVLRRLREMHCDCPVAVVTGLDDAKPAFEGTDIINVFKKPLGVRDFEKLIRQYAPDAVGSLPSEEEEAGSQPPA